MTLAGYISHAIEKLKDFAIDNPQLDARLLICHGLGCSRVDLLSQSERILNDNEMAFLDALIARRVAHEPVARIIGSREFWGLEFGLNEATLEPRPDSETLVESVLVSQKEQPIHMPRILDIGTGTGCLLLSLLHEIPNAIGVGIDINPRAVEQALQNAENLGLNDRVQFIVSNWFEKITGTFDIIISNPPYIPASDIPALMPEVRDFDPLLALDGGEDGLTPYRLLIPQLKTFLNPNSIAAFEVGMGQAQQVEGLFHDNGFTNTEIHKDLGGIDRCITTYMNSGTAIADVDAKK